MILLKQVTAYKSRSKERLPLIAPTLIILLGLLLILSFQTGPARAQLPQEAPSPPGTLQATGLVSGQVTGPGGTPLVAIKVTVYDARTYQRLGEGLTDGNGDYAINITLTPYKLIKVRVNHKRPNGPENDDYVTEWYPDADYFSQAGVITLPESGTVTNVDVSLEQGGTISGQANFSGSSVPAEDVEVNIYASDGSYRIRTFADSNGQFVIKGLRPGQYALQFGSLSEQRIAGHRQWYQGKPTLEEANLVTVTDGNTTEINLSLTTPGYIAGTVTDETTNDPISFALVRVYDQQGQAVSSTGTDQNGNYTVGALATGLYRVEFSASEYASEYYDNQATLAAATLIPVTAGQTTPNINAALALDPGPPTPDPRGTVAGTITKDGGQPLDPQDSAYISLVNISGSGDYNFFTSDGQFKNTFVRPGTYKVFFDGGTLRDEWYENKSSEATADTITVTEGMTTTLTVDLASNRGCIAGTLRTGSGSPIEGTSIVGIHEADFSGGSYPLPTDADGRYNSCDSDFLLEGDYVVSFIESPYVPEWYDDIYYRSTTGYKDATIVTVPANQTTTVDAALDVGGCISGKVIDEVSQLRHLLTSITVKDAAGEPVFFYRLDIEELSGFSTADLTAQGGGPTHHTDPSGEFVVCGLPTGTFTLQGFEGGQQTYLETVEVTVGQETPGVVLIFPEIRDIYLPLVYKN